jgi:hypothetical protein
MNKNPGQRIFKFSAIERMRNDLRSGDSLEGYFRESYPVKEDDLRPSTILPQGKMPELQAPEDDPVAGDLPNAIALHEYYKGIDETQASDPRLWAYLSHVQFREYTLARWGYGGVYKDLKDEAEKNKAKTYFFEHWFVSGNDRDLRRHAIARLWWAAHLTYAPWESDPEFFGDLKNEDSYYYTRVLFSTQDIYQQVLERAMGRSNRILISVLDYLGKHPEWSREKVRSLMKELNLAYGTKKLITLDRPALKSLIEKIASEV